jgi:TRAP-type C4-dicarboxylate transport system substrate-binding protein
MLGATFLVLTATTGSAQTKWKYIILSPAGQSYVPIQQQFAREITEKSGGRLEVTVYPAGELPYKGTEHLKVVERGLVQMGEVFAAANFGDAPPIMLADLPFIALNDDETKVLRATMFPIVEETLRARGVEMVAWAYYPPLQAATRTPARGLADLKGRKIRIPGGVFGEVLKLWQAVPAFIVWPEVYPAAQRGVVDGLVTAFQAMETAKLYEVLPYLMEFDGGLNHLYIGVNRDAWSALTPDLQKIVKEAGVNWMKTWEEVIVREGTRKAVELMVSKTGHPVVKVPLAERQKTREQLIPVLRDYIRTKVGDKHVAAYEKLLTELKLK